MKVTTAICTWNRCDLLRQTLEQLTRVTVPNGLDWEVLVVNNNCSDRTDDVIADFAGRLPLRRVFEGTPGVANARNAAMSAATGEWVLFVDDDVLVDESWLAEFVAATKALPEAAAAGGVIEPWFPEAPDPALLEVFPRLSNGFCGLNHAQDAGPLPDNLFVWGANMAYRLSAIHGLRFDPTYGVRQESVVGGEETDFVRRLRAAGGVVLWWPKMKVRHYVAPSRMTLGYLLQHQAGEGTLRVLTARPATPPTIQSVPRWLLRRFVEVGLRRWLSPVLGHRAWAGLDLESGPSPAGMTSRRVRALTWRRELAMLRGMIRGYRLRGGGEEPSRPLACAAGDSAVSER